MPKGRRGSGSSKKNSGDGGNNELETPLNDGVNNELEKPLKKGTWTSEEDKILIDYVKRHGAGNWNAVQKNSGLSRCGKSCRLRWVNHLRPDLRKDKFTPEEEELVTELHHRLGNKWSCMAAKMSGRTDNEIKNFWNTRLKRVRRTGGAVYPDEICQKVQEAKQRGHNIDALASDKVQSQCAMWSDGSMDIPEITFERMDYTRMDYTSMSEGNFPDSLRRILPSSSDDYITNNDPCNMMEGANLSDIVNMDLVVNSHVDNPDLLAEFNALLDSHLPGNEFNALLDSHLPGNATCFLSSTPFTHGDGKLELPSFQHVDDAQAADLSNADNQMPPLESEDTLNQSPMTGQTPSYSSPSMNNQLLESVLYQSHMLSDAQSLGQGIDMLLQPSSLISHINPISASSSGNFRTFSVSWKQHYGRGEHTSCNKNQP